MKGPTVVDVPQGDDRPPAYWEGDTLIIRCSAFGGCIWELIASAQEYPPGSFPQVLVKAFQEGKEAEPLVLRELEQNGFALEGLQEEEHLRVAPNALIRFHPDAKGSSPFYDGQHVIEVKAFGKDLFERAQRHGVQSTIPEYSWQLSIMMIRYNLPGLWVVHNKAYGEPRFEDLLIQRIPEPLIPRHAILTRAATIMEGIEDDVLDRPCDDPKHWPCRYLHLRPEPEGNGVDTVLDMSALPDDVQAEYDRLAKEYAYLKGQEDEIKKRRDDKKKELLALAGNFRRIKSDKFVTAIIPGKNRYVDRNKLIQAGLDPEEFMSETLYNYPQVRGLE